MEMVETDSRIPFLYIDKYVWFDTEGGRLLLCGDEQICWDTGEHVFGCTEMFLKHERLVFHSERSAYKESILQFFVLIVSEKRSGLLFGRIRGQGTILHTVLSHERIRQTQSSVEVRIVLVQMRRRKSSAEARIVLV